MRQNMYPTDNMLTFLSEKLAEFTGGDSSSTTSVQDELVPYGFAPNASGEVLVAELEEDDIDDLFSLGENLSIAYHSNDITKIDIKEQERATTDVEEFPARNGSGKAVITKPVERKVMNKRRSLSNTRPSSSDVSRQRRSSDQESVSDKIQSAGNQEDPHPSNSEIQEKLAKQRELIARLSAPKTKTVKTSSSEVSSSVRRRHSPNSDDSKKLSSAKQRPKSEEYHRSTSSPSSSTSTAAATTSSSLHHEAKSSITSTISPSKPERNATTGKTHGFVRSKSHAPTSPKSRGRKLSPRSKPTAVTKPNMKNFAKDGEAVEEEQWNDVDEGMLAFQFTCFMLPQIPKLLSKIIFLVYQMKTIVQQILMITPTMKSLWWKKRKTFWKELLYETQNYSLMKHIIQKITIYMKCCLKCRLCS